jgi:hypothetical protein
MWIARIRNGVEYPPVRMDDFVTYLDGVRERRRPREPRAWKFDGGAAAISQSPEGALAGARAVLAQPDACARAVTSMVELMATMRGEA